MTPAYLVFMTFMTLAFLLMIAGYVSALFFIKRLNLVEEAALSPLKGAGLWKRMFTPGSFGVEAEPSRRRIARLYFLALAAFAIAILLFFILPAVPRS
ncbi:hypothetical protein FMN63_19610 [Stappia sp. BW2]|jgi:hypothetical protein|uniref:hypothetical protein n=1 Tax=Stappia sp. BW2 TaxID=2592622 RepID=UPI0011DE9466|nr:hypothetical protein [Stappia sp. BW2]TYC64676.1 hypothetical protein FMN63_19610 [Stappia sp. BW2]